MPSALSNLLAILALDQSDFLDGLTSAQDETATFASKMSGIGGAVVLGGLTATVAAVSAVGVAAWNAGMTMDEAMDTIATSTGATGPALEGLRADFEAVFKSVPVDAGVAADVIGVLNSRLDLSGTALQNLAKPLLEVSNLLGGDATAYAENFSRVIGDWNIPTEQAAGSLDKMYVAAQQAGVPLDNLMQRVVQYGAPMRGFGMSFEQSTALLAKWEAEGVNVETVMGGMRIAAGKFTKGGVDMATGLWSTVDAITNAKDSTEALTIATQVFGAKAAVDMVDTIRSGKFDIDKFTEAMQNADGAISATAASTADWPEMWKKFTNSMTVALAPLGQVMMSAVGDGLQGVTEMFNRPDVQQAITQFVNMAIGALGTLVTYIPVVLTAASNFVAWLQNNQGVVVGVFSALGTAALFFAYTSLVGSIPAIMAFVIAWGPVLLVLGLIGVAAYLLYQAWTTNFGGIQQKFAEFMVAWNAGVAGWQNFGAGFTVKWAEGLAGWQAFFAGVSAEYAAFKVNWDAGMAGWEAFLDGFGAKWAEGLAGWNNFFNGISAGVNAAVGAAIQLLQDLQNTLNNMTLPDWMTPGSPTPWEMGLRGVNQAMGQLANQTMPNFSAQLNLQPAAGTLGIDAAPAAGAVSTATAGGAGGNGDPMLAMLVEDLRVMLRSLPDDIARSSAMAAEKTGRR